MSPFKVHKVGFFEIDPGSIDSLAYSPTLELLSVVRGSNRIELWKISCGEDDSPFCTRTLDGNGESSIEAVAFGGPKLDRLFTCGLHGFVHEHDLFSLSTKRSQSVTSGPAWSMDYNAKVNALAVGTEEGFVTIFDLDDDALTYSKTLDRQEGRILSLKWHPDGRQLVTGSADTIRVWDAETGHPIYRMTTGRREKNRETTVWSLAFMKDYTIMSGDSRGKTCFWNGKTGTLIDAYQTHKADILSVHVDDRDSGGIAYSSGIDPVIMHFQPIQKKNGGQKWVKSLHRTPNTHDVRAILSLSHGKTLSVGVDTQLVLNHGKNVWKYPAIPRGSNVTVCSSSRRMLLRYPAYLEVWSLGSSNSEIKSYSKYLPLSTEPVKLIKLMTKDLETIRCCDMKEGFIAYSTPTRLCLYKLNQTEDRPIGLEKFSHISVPIVHHIKFFKTSSSPSNDDEIRLLIVTDHGDLHVFSIHEESKKVDLLFTKTSKELNLSPGIGHLCLQGSTVVLADYNNKSVAVDMSGDSANLLATFPMYNKQITAIGIHPKTSNVIFAYNDYTLLEASIKLKGKYTKFSAQVLSRLDCTKSMKQGRLPILGVLFETAKDEKIICYDYNSIYVIDKMSNLDANKSKRSRTRSSSFSSILDDEEDYIENNNSPHKIPDYPVKIIRKYKHLIHMETLAKDELMVVEVKPSTLDDKLPPAMRRKMFGAM